MTLAISIAQEAPHDDLHNLCILVDLPKTAVY